jgi:hypothetical protein
MLSASGVIASDARAGDFQVLYAEPIALRAEDARNAVAASEAGAPQAISFQAYGRQFDLELESNERLLSKVEPERRAALSRYELLRGRLSGLPARGSALHASAPSPIDQAFQFPTISVSSDRPVDDVWLDVSLPDWIQIESVSGTAATGCGFGATGPICNLFTITPGTPKTVVFTLRATQIGDFISTVRVRSPRDTNDQNNTFNVQILVRPAPAPPPSNQGGGGGGASGWATMLALLSALTIGRTHRRH